jgi:hypothetical protein
MKYLRFRIWTLITITPVIAAMIIRIIWELVVNPSTGGLVMSILVIFCLLGLYALIIYLLFRPDLKLLKSLPLWIIIAIAATGGLIGAILHFLRFLPSPQSELPWSLVIALLYALASSSAYGMLLWYVWTLWKKRKGLE